jgi:integrative and conjugative element protein (TIGR02256 family)
MQFLSSWATSNNLTLLHFSAPVIEVFEQHIQRAISDFEAGGILLGTIHGSNIMVTEATTPTVWDKRFKFLFERMPITHRSIAQLRWRKSDATIRYIGEWHTHPEDYPTPSGLDCDEWRKLSILRKDRRPLLAVIVGRKNLHVELVSNSEQRLIMSSIE